MTCVPKHLLTRPLFCNPACCLISTNADGTPNAMTVSWLTPLDNHTLFLLSLNAGRHTLSNLLAEGRSAFTLCPWVEGMEPLALACGGSSGAAHLGLGGKLAGLGVALCAPGGGAAGGGGCGPPALRDCPVHIACRVRGRMGLAGEDGAAEGGDALRGHVALLCSVEAAWVAAGYWGEGKLCRAGPGLPRLLSFLGSRVFAPIG